MTHPNVCRIFEVGIHRVASQPPMLFFAMELLHGHTLAGRIRAGRLTRDEVFPIAVQLAEGLEAAHRAGIVRADFTSANVILVPAGTGVRAVITDFGVARADPGSTVVDETRHSMTDETARNNGQRRYIVSNAPTINTIEVNAQGPVQTFDIPAGTIYPVVILD